MKICIVVDNLDTKTGWGRLAYHVSEGLQTRGHSVRTITQSGVASPNALVLSLKVSFLRDLVTLPSRLFRIRSFTTDCDAILCYDVNPYGIVISMATIGTRPKFILNCLGTYSLLTGSILKKVLARWVFHRASSVLIVSDFVRRQIEKSGVKLRPETHIVPVGVDSSFFSEYQRIQSEHPYIISVGGVKPRKGYDISLRAFALIAHEYLDLMYVIVGDLNLSSYVQKLKALANELGVSDRVQFKEHVTDEQLRSLYHSAKAFILTSITNSDMIEGFGMVYLEAGASGIPVIGPQNTGAEAAIVDGQTGYLTTHEPTNIASALRKVLDDETLAATLGQNGREHAKNYNWAHIIGLYDLYLSS